MTNRRGHRIVGRTQRLLAAVVMAALAFSPLAIPWAATPAGADGASSAVKAFGTAADLGTPTGPRTVGLAPTPSGDGYWYAGTDGGVFTYGDAQFYGSAGGLELARPIVGIAATKSGHGYWLVASDGGVFTFGDARFLGSTGDIALDAPIVDIVPTPSGHGYWLVALDGGVFTFGDARFLGSAAGVAHAWVLAAAATPSGHGYWITSADGGVYTFGDAGFYGAAADVRSGAVMGIAPTPSGRGYWIADNNGGLFTFGDAQFLGAATGTLPYAANAFAVRPDGHGYWISGTTPPTLSKPRALTAPPIPDNSGSGKRIVYSNSDQRIWLVEADGTLYDSYRVSGRHGIPSPDTYHVMRKLMPGRAGSLSLPYFVGFAFGHSTDIGFHGIPLEPNGTPIESDSQLGSPLSHGCVRQNQADAKELWDWTPVGTTVVVLA
jgi:hypothetical protein